MQLRSPSDTQDFQCRSRASPTIVPSPYPVARPKHRQRLNPRPRPPCCMESCCIFRGFEYASEYRGRRFDTGQHCFRSPIISAPRFRRFVPQGTLSLSFSLSPLSIYSSVSEASLSMPTPTLGASESELSSCHQAERHGERTKTESARDDTALRGAVNA